MRRSSVPAVVLMLSLACLLLPPAWAAPPAGEQVEAPDAAATEKVERSSDFDTLIERVRTARETGAWREANWAAGVDLERSLNRLMEDAGRAAHRDGAPKVGTPLADVRPGDVIRGRTANVLHVAEHIDVAFADRCVFLADGDVRVSHASDCVIIAGGAVNVAHGRRNLILAGHYVHVSHDGHPTPRDQGPGGNGSVLLAGQVLDVSHATGTICSSPGQVRISHAKGVTFVNSPDVKTSHRTACRDVPDAPPLAAVPPPRVNPLADKLTITQMAGGDDPRRAMVVTRQGGVELVTRLGEEVKGADGKPVEGLAGWRLSFVNGDFALFRRGAETAGFAMPSQP